MDANLETKASLEHCYKYPLVCSLAQKTHQSSLHKLEAGYGFFVNLCCLWKDRYHGRQGRDMCRDLGQGRDIVETCNRTELQLNGITFELGWVSKDQMNLSIKPYSQLH